MKVTYLGTASVLLEYGGLRLITDPVFDPPGTSYSMGPSYVPAKWFMSTKQYDTPLDVEQLGTIDALLLSHDHHRDNLDRAGRAFALGNRVRAVITNPHAARRLSRKRDGVIGLATGQSTTMGAVTVTAIFAQHASSRRPVRSPDSSSSPSANRRSGSRVTRSWRRRSGRPQAGCAGVGSTPRSSMREV